MRRAVYLLPWVSMLACAVSAAAILVWLQPRVGLPVDMGENIAFGQEMLRGWQGQRLNFTDDLPDLPCPEAYLPFLRSMPHIFYPATTTLASALAQLMPAMDQAGFPAAHFRINAILLVLLGVVMLATLGPLFGRWQAVGSFVLLITLPRLFGEAVLNLKDFPQFVYSACFLCTYLRWRTQGGWSWLAMAGVFLGVGTATKPDTVFALVAVLLADLPWLWDKLRRNEAIPVRAALLFFLCLIVVAGLCVFTAYLPILTKLEENPIVFLAKGLTYAIAVNKNPSVGWNLHIPGYVVAATPPLFILAMLGGLLAACADARHSVLLRALLLYFLIVVFRSAVPGANPYGGVRQFLGFMFPASLFVVLVIGRLPALVGIRTAAAARAVMVSVFLLVAAGNIFALRASAPYFTTYFSELVGGLAGAQKRGMPFAGDNWNVSYAEAGRWLDENAAEGATIAVFEYPHLLQHAIARPDISVQQVEASGSGGHDYLVTTYRKEWRLNEPTNRPEPRPESALQGGKLVLRQGGPVLAVVPLPPSGDR